ncbi:SSM4 [Symbiodinium sp. CCMP2456]|nr:SSM4 [Symbiodinium sp. CCMP2456]
MSFVQRLSRQSSTARDQQVASDREEIQQWVAAQVTRFEHVCEQQSRRGNFSARIDEQVVVKGLKRLGMDNYETELRQALGAYGFEQLTVEVNHPLFCGICNLSMSASWGGAEGCEAGLTTARGGFVGPCGICHEDRPMVVLAPCGHVLCPTCRQQIAHQCPFCREPVRTTTFGLFID